MAIAFVSSNKWLNADSTFSELNVSKAFAVNVTAGSLLVAVEQWDGADETQTFSDNNGNTWTTLKQAFDGGALVGGLAIGYAMNANAGATTVTVASAGTRHRSLDIAELTGAATSSAVDGTATSAVVAGGGDVTVAPGAITTTGAGIVIGVAMSSTTGWNNPTANASFTRDVARTPVALNQMGIETWITSASGTPNPDWSAPQSHFFVALGAAFKIASGGGGSTLPPQRLILLSVG